MIIKLRPKITWAYFFLCMKFTSALKNLIIEDPFYGLFLLNLNKFPNNSISTLCVSFDNTSFNLQYNEIFWDSLTDTEQIAVLKHETLHIVFKHLLYFKEFPNHKIANIAHDLEINQYITGLPEGAILLEDMVKIFPQYSQKFVAKAGSLYYYKLLLQIQQESPSNEINLEKLSTLDDHSVWQDPGSSAETEILEDQIKTYIQNSVDNLSKNRGSVPGFLVDYIKNLLKEHEPVFNWKQYFRRLIGNSYNVFTKKSLRKVSKRFEGSAGIKLKKRHHLLVGIDTSGSVNSEDLADFASEINYIYKNSADITVVQCDTKINSIQEYKNIKQLTEIKGRGGTDFNPVIDYYFENRSKYTALIYFTDGYSSVENLKFTRNLIWVISSDGDQSKTYPGIKINIPKRK